MLPAQPIQLEMDTGSDTDEGQQSSGKGLDSLSQIKNALSDMLGDSLGLKPRPPSGSHASDAPHSRKASRPPSVLPRLLRKAPAGLTANLKGFKCSESDEDDVEVAEFVHPASPTVTKRSSSFLQATQVLTPSSQSMIMRIKPKVRRPSASDYEFDLTHSVTSAHATSNGGTNPSLLAMSRTESYRFSDVMPGAGLQPSQVPPQPPTQPQPRLQQRPFQQPQSQSQPQPQAQFQSQPQQPRLGRRSQTLVPSAPSAIAIAQRSNASTDGTDRDAQYGFRAASPSPYDGSATSPSAVGISSRASTPTNRTYTPILGQGHRISAGPKGQGPGSGSGAGLIATPFNSISGLAMAAAAAAATVGVAPASPVFGGSGNSGGSGGSGTGGPKGPFASPPGAVPPSGKPGPFRTNLDPNGLHTAPPGSPAPPHPGPPGGAQLQATPTGGGGGGSSHLLVRSYSSMSARHLSVGSAASNGAAWPSSGSERNSPQPLLLPLPLLASARASGHSFSNSSRPPNPWLQAAAGESDDTHMVRRTASATSGHAALYGGGGGDRMGSNGGAGGGGGGRLQAEGSSDGSSSPAGGTGGGDDVRPGEVTARNASRSIGTLLRGFAEEGPMSAAARQLAALHRATAKGHKEHKGQRKEPESGHAPVATWRPLLSSSRNLRAA